VLRQTGYAGENVLLHIPLTEVEVWMMMDGENSRKKPQNAAKEEKLTRKQQALIAAMLSSPSLIEASRIVGISDDTARRWLALPHVRAAYNEACNQLLDTALTGLALTVEKAIETLKRNLSEDAPPPTQVRAAHIVLEQTLAIRKMGELEQRLADLEDRLNENAS